LKEFLKVLFYLKLKEFLKVLKSFILFEVEIIYTLAI
tara:strand:+ start:391 stop:501 length:111 start_codon:yes stop_codon:yes gene_type:complete